MGKREAHFIVSPTTALGLFEIKVIQCVVCMHAGRID